MGKLINLSGKKIEPLTICLIGGAGFIGMNLCLKLIEETPHKAIVIDVSSAKINNLLLTREDRIEFHQIDFKTDYSRLKPFIITSDLIINLEAFRKPADYNLSAISSTVHYDTHLIQYCIEGAKRLIHFSTCDVYGKTIESFLPYDSPLQLNPEFYAWKEDVSPCILGSVVDQRWSYACAKQLTERLILAEATKHDLNFTIVRPFNWIGPRSDFIPGTDGPHDRVPGTLACFIQNLFNGERLRLVDRGYSRRTFCFIDDAIEALLLIIDNPEKANRQIFNVGNPENNFSVRHLATLMMHLYARVSNVPLDSMSTLDVSTDEFYGRAYDVTYRRIPDVTNITRQLGWKPKMSDFPQLLEDILAYHANMHHVPSPPSKKPRIDSSSDTY